MADPTVQSGHPPAARTHMRRLLRVPGLTDRVVAHGPLLIVLGAGLLLRVVLAFVVAPGQGFATDLRIFGQWADTLATTGPGAFYGAAAADYPPGYLSVLWALGSVSRAAAPFLGAGARRPPWRRSWPSWSSRRR